MRLLKNEAAFEKSETRFEGRRVRTVLTPIYFTVVFLGRHGVVENHV